MLVLCLLPLVYLPCVIADAQLTGGRTTDGALLMKCHKTSYFGSAFWKRNETIVLRTTHFWFDEFYVDSLESGTRKQTFGRDHYFKIYTNLPINLASNWSCAEHEDGPYSEPVTFTESSETTLAPITIVGNLNLTVYPSVLYQGQEVTLTCTAESPIGYWEVMWVRNNSPLFFTSSNSSVIGYYNVTVANETIPGNITVGNVTVAANEVQHNVTFLAESEILDDSSWICLSSEASNQLNFTGHVVKSKPSTRVFMPDGTGSNSDLTLVIYITAATGGVILLTVIISVAVCIRKRHHRRQDKEKIWTSKNSGIHPQRNLSLVTRENSLYETSDELPLKTKPEHYTEVTVDNILYSGSFKEDQTDTYLTAV